MKLNRYSKVFLLGFGFFAISITWSVYNAFIPLLLGKFIESTALIGFIMTFDNYFALFIQPAVGSMSDSINTKFGKRMPFIMIGMPLAALFIFILPNYSSVKTLILFLVIMNLCMSIFRSPVVSLMPDITPPKNRSMANSIINVMGGLGSVLGYFVVSILWGKIEKFPFYMAAILMLFSLLILFTFIKEKRDSINYEKETINNLSFLKNTKSLFKNKNTLYLLFAICSWFISFQGIEALFTLYGQRYIGVSGGTAASTLTFISLSFLLFAVPSGILGTKLGKKKTITLGIIGMLMCFIILAFVKSIILIRILFSICGLFWAMININSYPFVTDMAPEEQVGTYTGFYYFFSSIAAIVSPPALGFIMDKIGYQFMFVYGTLFFVIALIFILLIKDSSTENHIVKVSDL